MKSAILTTILTLALLIPGLAFACGGSYVSDVSVAANCDGWSACFTIEFVEDEMEVDLDYAVALLGDDGMPLESYTVRMAVARDETGAPTATFCVEQIWEGYYDNPPFQVAIGAEICGSDAIGETIDVDCVVANDEQSWDSVKSLYR